MKIKELLSTNDLQRVIEDSWHDRDETMLPPMFHGTDASLIDMSQEKRVELKNACETLITTLLMLYKANSISISDERLVESRDSYGCSSTAYYMAEAKVNKSPLYSYGDYYVTNNPERAFTYSQEAWIFGETGWIANRIIEGAIALGLDLPNDECFRKAFAIVETRKQKEKSPAVIMTINASSFDLFTEGGQNYRELYAEDFSKEIQDMKSDMFSTSSFRLNIHQEKENVVFFLVRKANYSELLDVWKRSFRSKE